MEFFGVFLKKFASAIFLPRFTKFKIKGVKHLLQIFKEISNEKIVTPFKKTLLHNNVKALNSFIKFFEETHK